MRSPFEPSRMLRAGLSAIYNNCNAKAASAVPRRA
jgi:hypothetical protein